MKPTLFLSLALFIVVSTARGQYLRFDDMLKIQSLDSTSLKQFCAEKRYEVKKVTETSHSVTYTFQSIDHKSVSFSRSFPRDPKAAVSLNYYLNNAKEYRQLK